jgi:hypothetical protein
LKVKEGMVERMVKEEAANDVEMNCQLNGYLLSHLPSLLHLLHLLHPH